MRDLGNRCEGLNKDLQERRIMRMRVSLQEQGEEDREKEGGGCGGQVGENLASYKTRGTAGRTGPVFQWKGRKMRGQGGEDRSPWCPVK